MDNNTRLLEQIGELIEEKLVSVKNELKEVKEQGTNLELKIEIVNNRIGQAQEETIEALTALMSHAYDTNEKRFKRIEGHLHLPPQQ